MSKTLIKKLEAKSKDELLDIIANLLDIKGVNEFINIHYILTPDDKIKSIKKTFAKYQRKTRFYDYYEAIEFFNNIIDEVLKPIEIALIQEAPEASANLLQSIIDAFEKLIQAKDDSSGCAWDFLHNCVNLWGHAWYSVPKKDLNKLAELVFNYYSNHQYIKSEIFDYFKLALGQEGLICLEKYLSNDTDGLLYVIELQNNPDKYITTVNKLNVDNDKVRLKVATMLIDNLRSTEAIKWLRQISSNSSNKEIYKLRQDLLIKAFYEDSHNKEAQEVRWETFVNTLEPQYYQDFIKYASSEEQDRIRQLAIEHSLKSTNIDVTLKFLESINEYDYIETLITKSLEKLNEYNYSYYRKLSKTLATNGKFLSATLLRRYLVDNVLFKATSKYYDYAVSDLKLAIAFGNEVQDWGDYSDNKKYFSNLFITHKKKYSFWDKVGDLVKSIK
jgi:hypothetical protein